MQVDLSTKLKLIAKVLFIRTDDNRDFCKYPEDAEDSYSGLTYKHNYIDICDLVSTQAHQFFNMTFLVVLLIVENVLLVKQFNKNVKPIHKFKCAHLFGCGLNSIKHSCSLKAILWMIIITFSTSMAVNEPILVTGMLEEWENYDIDNCYSRTLTKKYGFNCDQCEIFFQ